MVCAMTRYGKGCHVMAKNSAEGNKARTARYRAGLAERGIRPVQLYAPEAAHALLRQAAGLMSREHDPLEPRQALRQVSGANDSGEGHGEQAQALIAAAAEVEAVRAKLIEAREARCQAEQRADAQAEVAQAATEGTVAAIGRAEVAERAQEALAGKLREAEDAAAQARAETERLEQMPGLRGRVARWMTR